MGYHRVLIAVCQTCRQPILADEVQTFKALITVHKVLQEGHPITVKEAQANVNWLESLTRGISGEGLRGSNGLAQGRQWIGFGSMFQKSLIAR